MIARLPERTLLSGQYARLEPLDSAKHLDDLWPRVGGEHNAALWTWMPDGPYLSKTDLDAGLTAKAATADPLFFAVIDQRSTRATGFASLMRIEAKHGVIEVGGVMYSPELQRSRIATEAMYLFARYVFEDLGNRRFEWKCDSLNEPSRRAAKRLGFQFEGIFRQHMMIKGENRDTAWFSMLDTEWPARKAAFERWLDPANFTAAGTQLRPLR
ncbi:MAG: family acetyltransferase [Bryobacterales bacterium]|jgi:RimJ/RimL family protein N-acetyltransferase|nr:family acetyltransferase [Bryobacterales bacterium]